MEKRYQVFVSSTYTDLKDERQSVTQTLMEMDCIPAGMELFPAADDEQWEFIKRVIDDCDYYILILGGRYGSLTDSGISYTEQEYDYAISVGLKVLAFVHGSPDEISFGKSDVDPELRKKLDTFRTKVISNRLVKFWENPAELPGMVALSLSKTIKLYPAVGWVRAHNIANDEILGDLNALRKENDKLKNTVEQLSEKNIPEELDLAPLDSILDVNLKWSTYDRYGTNRKSQTVSVTWYDIFNAIAPSLIEHPNNLRVSNIIADRLYCKDKDTTKAPSNIMIETDQFETIRIQLTSLGLVKVNYNKSTDGKMMLFWTITNKGQELLLKLRTVKSSSS